MIVGFDTSQTGASKAGCGCLADSLIRALATLPHPPDFLLYPHFGDLFWDPQGLETTYRHPRNLWPTRATFPSHAAAQEFWRNPPPNLENLLGNPDIVHSNNFFAPRGLEHARLVWTLHDVLFLSNPEWTTEANRMGCFHGAFGAAIRADWIVANSRYSRSEFLRYFPAFPASRITVASLASRFSGLPPAPASAAPPNLEPHSFWLAVGTLEPRKNLRSILAALRLKPDAPLPNLPLALAGGAGWMMEDFREECSGLDVRPLGYVSDLTLQWLYENCFGFLYPSLGEGFGLPVLEALSCGAAVVTSQRTSLPEVAGDAALYCDPADPASLLAAMVQLAQDRDWLRAAARPRSSLFSWQSTAQSVLDVYQEVVRQPRRNSPLSA